MTEKIIGAAIEVHRILGSGLWESIYEAALCHELHSREIFCERQKEVDVIYKGHIVKGQKLDASHPIPTCQQSKEFYGNAEAFANH